MIVGIGFDLVSTHRFADFVQRHGRRGLERLFTKSEIEYCLSVAVPALSLAARFAAKEAFFKALGTGFGRGIAWTELEVLRSTAGAPMLALHGAAMQEAERLGICNLHLSLSHTSDTAGALVVLES
jgi:holo-[acyl-carrier protein] synthase